nr:hypothetical protein [Clostridium simiarum]
MEALLERFNVAKKVINDVIEINNLKETLAEKIAEGKQYEEDDYVKSSWDKLNSVLYKASQVLKNPKATKEEIQEQINLVDVAIKALIIPAPNFEKEKFVIEKSNFKGQVRFILENAEEGLTYYVTNYFGPDEDAPSVDTIYEGKVKEKFNTELENNTLVLVPVKVNTYVAIIAVDKDGKIVNFQKEFMWYYMVP